MYCLNEVLITKRNKSLKEVEKSLDKFVESNISTEIFVNI